MSKKGSSKQKAATQNDKLDLILEKLDSIDKRVSLLELHQRLRIPSGCISKSYSGSEGANEDVKKQEPPKKSGKFFDDQQRLFLSLQLEEVLEYLKNVSVQDKDEQILHMQNLTSVIDAVKLKQKT